MGYVHTALQITLALLIGFTTLHKTLQIHSAHQTYRQWVSETPTEGTEFPSVDIIVPSYNESPEALDACLGSIAAQEYAGQFSVYVVDDGSTSIMQLRPIYQKYEAFPNFRIRLLEQNVGKREAQLTAVHESIGDLLFAVDSDTQLESTALSKLVGAMDDPSVGAAMGDIQVSNLHSTWLTRLLGDRYWVEFNQEKAAQSTHGGVLCCSGPFTLYRRTVFEKLIDEYRGYSFRGQLCGYGEDRHLTTLILQTGLRTVYVPGARSATVVPADLKTYLRQQLRWNRGIYLELRWILPQLRHLSPYLTLETLAWLAYPALISLPAALTAVSVALGATGTLASTAAAFAFVALANCAYGVWRNRSLRFLSYLGYGALHAALLIPLRVRALCTLADNQWGTR